MWFNAQHDMRLCNCLTRSTKYQSPTVSYMGIRCSWGETRIFLCTELANKYKTACKQNTKWWRLPTIVAASHHYLTHPPLAEMTIRWSWLVVVCLGAGWVAPRRPWDDGAPWLKSVYGAHFVSVLYVGLRGRHSCPSSSFPSGWWKNTLRLKCGTY